ncbi:MULTISPECIES: hypothetical protein [Chryseobacterium group]|uniref:Uncharacterized protein n=1 Tax=Chryseobacterium taklimakanense TaxID=536441 RepID=A0A239XXG9_9FLAO|nr:MULTISPECIES: hypothetical protein [Chryseobacterium group]SNV51100.1 Uncharacterised protein [Chryseobacterium taklimakanense]
MATKTTNKLKTLFLNLNLDGLMTPKTDNPRFVDEFNDTVNEASIMKFQKEFISLFDEKYFCIRFFYVYDWLQFRKRFEISATDSEKFEKAVQLIKPLYGVKVYYDKISKEHFTDIILFLREFASLCHIDISLNDINTIIENRYP